MSEESVQSSLARYRMMVYSTVSALSLYGAVRVFAANHWVGGLALCAVALLLGTLVWGDVRIYRGNYDRAYLKRMNVAHGAVLVAVLSGLALLAALKG